MTGPTITPMLRGNRFRVHCTEHRLDRTVDTQSHADNLLALHLRRDHAEDMGTVRDQAVVTLRLSDAAAYVAVIHDDPITAPLTRDTLLRTWALLIGENDLDAALSYARQIAPGDLLAHTPPF